MSEQPKKNKKINSCATIVLMTFVFWFIMMLLSAIFDDSGDIFYHMIWSLILFGYGPIISFLFSLLFVFLLRKRGVKLAIIITMLCFLLYFVTAFFIMP